MKFFGKQEFPRKAIGDNGVELGHSVDVIAMDKNGSPVVVYYDFDKTQWCSTSNNYHDLVLGFTWAYCDSPKDLIPFISLTREDALEIAHVASGMKLESPEFFYLTNEQIEVVDYESKIQVLFDLKKKRINVECADDKTKVSAPIHFAAATDKARELGYDI